MVIIWKYYGYHSKSPRCAFGEATGCPVGNRDNTKNKTRHYKYRAQDTTKDTPYKDKTFYEACKDKTCYEACKDKTFYEACKDTNTASYGEKGRRYLFERFISGIRIHQSLHPVYCEPEPRIPDQDCHCLYPCYNSTRRQLYRF